MWPINWQPLPQNMMGQKEVVDDLVGAITRYRAGSLSGFETCSPVMDPAMKDLEIQGHSTRALL